MSNIYGTAPDAGIKTRNMIRLTDFNIEIQAASNNAIIQDQVLADVLFWCREKIDDKWHLQWVCETLPGTFSQWRMERGNTGSDWVLYGYFDGSISDYSSPDNYWFRICGADAAGNPITNWSVLNLKDGPIISGVSPGVFGWSFPIDPDYWQEEESADGVSGWGDSYSQPGSSREEGGSNSGVYVRISGRNAEGNFVTGYSNVFFNG